MNAGSSQEHRRALPASYLLARELPLLLQAQEAPIRQHSLPGATAPVDKQVRLTWKRAAGQSGVLPPPWDLLRCRNTIKALLEGGREAAPKFPVGILNCLFQGLLALLHQCFRGGAPTSTTCSGL